MTEHKADISVEEFVAKLISSPATPRASRIKKPRLARVEDKQTHVSSPQKRKKSPDSEHRPKKSFKRYERSKLHVIINPSLDSEPPSPVPIKTINTRQNNANIQDDDDVTILSEKDESRTQRESKTLASNPQSSPPPPSQDASLGHSVQHKTPAPDSLESIPVHVSSKILKAAVRTNISAVVTSNEPPVAKLSRAERHARARQLKREKKRQRKEARRLRKREHAKAAEKRKLDAETEEAKHVERLQSPPAETAHMTVLATQELSQTTVFATQDQSQYETADEVMQAVAVSSVQLASASVDSEEDAATIVAPAIAAAKSKSKSKSKTLKTSKTPPTPAPPANSDRVVSASKNSGYVLFDVFTGTKPAEADAQEATSPQNIFAPLALSSESGLATPQPAVSEDAPLFVSSPSLEAVAIPYDSSDNRLLSKKGALILERICSMGTLPDLQRKSGFDPKKKIRLVEIGRLRTVEEKRKLLADSYLETLGSFLHTRAERKK